MSRLSAPHKLAAGVATHGAYLLARRPVLNDRGNHDVLDTVAGCALGPAARRLAW